MFQTVLALKGAIPYIPRGNIKASRTSKVLAFRAPTAMSIETVYEENAADERLHTRAAWRFQTAEEFDEEEYFSVRFKLTGRPEDPIRRKDSSRHERRRCRCSGSWKSRRAQQSSLYGAG